MPKSMQHSGKYNPLPSSKLISPKVTDPVTEAILSWILWQTHFTKQSLPDRGFVRFATDHPNARRPTTSHSYMLSLAQKSFLASLNRK